MGKSRPLDNLPLEFVGLVLNLQVCHLLIQLIPDILEVSNCPQRAIRCWKMVVARGEGLGGEQSSEISITGPKPSCYIRFSLSIIHQSFHSNFFPTTPPTKFHFFYAYPSWLLWHFERLWNQVTMKGWCRCCWRCGWSQAPSRYREAVHTNDPWWKVWRLSLGNWADP